MEKKAFAANVLQRNYEKCPPSVFAGCSNEILLLGSINKVKGHQVQKWVKYNKYSTWKKRHFAAKVLQSKQGTCPILVSICMFAKWKVIIKFNKLGQMSSNVKIWEMY